MLIPIQEPGEWVKKAQSWGHESTPGGHSSDFHPCPLPRYTCPFVEKFSIEIETYYLPDGGQQPNVFNLSGAERRQRILGETGATRVHPSPWGGDRVEGAGMAQCLLLEPLRHHRHRAGCSGPRRVQSRRGSPAVPLCQDRSRSTG